MSITFDKCSKLECWSADDVNALTRRIDAAKEQSACSLSGAMEIIEILEQLQDLIPNSPENQQRYFRETADDLLTLAISWLGVLRAKL